MFSSKSCWQGIHEISSSSLFLHVGLLYEQRMRGWRGDPKRPRACHPAQPAQQSPIPARILGRVAPLVAVHDGAPAANHILDTGFFDDGAPFGSGKSVAVGF